jgi:phage terminase large subunit-like protein
MDIAYWNACQNGLNKESLKGRKCYAGLDLSTSIDLSSLVLVFPSENDPGIYDILPFFWIPKDNIDARIKRDRIPYDVWINKGFINATPGNVIDYKFIIKKIEEISKEYDLQEIAFDRWGATKIIQDLQEKGFKVVEFGQGFASMSPPTKEFQKLVMSKGIRHDGNPVLKWNVDNLVVREDPAGNIKPDKEKSRERIDGAVATIMGLDRALRLNKSRSIYEDRGVLVFK